MGNIDELTEAYNYLSKPTFPQVSMPRGRNIKICRDVYWRKGQFYVKLNGISRPILSDEASYRCGESALAAGIDRAIDWCYKMRSWREVRAQRVAQRDPATPEVLRALHARNTSSFREVVEELLSELSQQCAGIPEGTKPETTVYILPNVLWPGSDWQKVLVRYMVASKTTTYDINNSYDMWILSNHLAARVIASPTAMLNVIRKLEQAIEVAKGVRGE